MSETGLAEPADAPALTDIIRRFEAAEGDAVHFNARMVPPARVPQSAQAIAFESGYGDVLIYPVTVQGLFPGWTGKRTPELVELASLIDDLSPVLSVFEQFLGGPLMPKGLTSMRADAELLHLNNQTDPQTELLVRLPDTFSAARAAALGLAGDAYQTCLNDHVPCLLSAQMTDTLSGMPDQAEEGDLIILPDLEAASFTLMAGGGALSVADIILSGSTPKTKPPSDGSGMHLLIRGVSLPLLQLEQLKQAEGGALDLSVTGYTASLSVPSVLRTFEGVLRRLGDAYCLEVAAIEEGSAHGSE